MKRLIVALFSLVSANALAAPQVSPIVRMDLDSRLVGGSGRYNGGSIVIDARAREASLTLAFKCPRGRVCPAMVVRPYEVTLPIVSRKTTNCGSVYYTAKIDKRAVDGMLKELVVVDNGGNRCPTLQYLPPVEATYETEGSRMGGTAVRTRSTFEGARFIVPMYNR